MRACHCILAGTKACNNCPNNTTFGDYIKDGDFIPYPEFDVEYSKIRYGTSTKGTGDWQ